MLCWSQAVSLQVGKSGFTIEIGKIIVLVIQVLAIRLMFFSQTYTQCGIPTKQVGSNQVEATINLLPVSLEIVGPIHFPPHCRGGGGWACLVWLSIRQLYDYKTSPEWFLFFLTWMNLTFTLVFWFLPRVCFLVEVFWQLQNHFSWMWMVFKTKLCVSSCLPQGNPLHCLIFKTVQVCAYAYKNVQEKISANPTLLILKPGTENEVIRIQLKNDIWDVPIPLIQSIYIYLVCNTFNWGNVALLKTVYLVVQ